RSADASGESPREALSLLLHPLLDGGANDLVRGPPAFAEDRASHGPARDPEPAAPADPGERDEHPNGAAGCLAPDQFVAHRRAGRGLPGPPHTACAGPLADQVDLR